MDLLQLGCNFFVSPTWEKHVLSSGAALPAEASCFLVLLAPAAWEYYCLPPGKEGKGCGRRAQKAAGRGGGHGHGRSLGLGSGSARLGLASDPVSPTLPTVTIPKQAREPASLPRQLRGRRRKAASLLPRAAGGRRRGAGRQGLLPTLGVREAGCAGRRPAFIGSEG